MYVPLSHQPFFRLAYVSLKHGAYLSLRENIFLQASPENLDSKSLTLLKKKDHLKGKNSQNSVGKLFPPFTVHTCTVPKVCGD